MLVPVLALALILVYCPALDHCIVPAHVPAAVVVVVPKADNPRLYPGVEVGAEAGRTDPDPDLAEGE